MNFKQNNKTMTALEKAKKLMPLTVQEMAELVGIFFSYKCHISNETLWIEVDYKDRDGLWENWVFELDDIIRMNELSEPVQELSSDELPY